MTDGPFDAPLPALGGGTLDPSLLLGRAVLVVNVASKCGFAPQYEGLQALHDRYADRGLTVLGVPCNQFAEQEPLDESEIAEFCSTTYGVSFPLTERLDVNGRHAHPLFAALTGTPDAHGEAGEVRWNFEKFLVAPSGDPVARFRSIDTPDSPALVDAVETALPEAGPVWERRAATAVGVGDHVRLESGTVMTVTRIDKKFMGRDDMLCLVEDSDVRWLARPLGTGAEIEVLAA